MKTIFLAVSLFASISLFGQYELHYNLYNDSIQWYSDGKPSKQPRMRKGDQITFRLEELNQSIYVTNLDVQYIDEEDEANGFLFLAQMAGGFLPGIDGMLTGQGPSSQSVPETAPPPPAPTMTLSDVPLLKINDKTISIGSLFANKANKDGDKANRGSTGQLVQQSNQNFTQLAETVEEFKQTYLQTKDLERAAFISRIAGTQINNIKANGRLKPSTGHRIITEYYRQIFRHEPSESATLEHLMAYREIPAQFEANLDLMRNQFDDFTKQESQLQKISTQLNQQDLEQLDPEESSAINTYTREMRNTIKSAKLMEDRWKAMLLQGEAMLNSEFMPSFEEMALLQIEMLQYLQQPISQQHIIKLEGDQTNLHMDIFHSPMLENDSSNELPVKTIKISMNTTGGLRIRAGAGVQFSQFFTAAQQYDVRENLIIAEPGDRFTPSFASMIHFYRTPRRNTTFGGSLGIGIPLQGENKGISFFFGPSLLFGKDSRMALTGGIALAKAERLARGFAVGDTFDLTFGDLPTKTRYETGWFIGLSFNIGKVK